jgi:hypothetical protein
MCGARAFPRIDHGGRFDAWRRLTTHAASNMTQFDWGLVDCILI